jgi:hypothetical protein
VRLLVSGCTVSAGRLMAKRPDRLGVLMTPRAGNRIPVASATGTVWAADNDCFQGLHAPRYLRFLAKIVESGSRPQWVTCPDVVGDMGATWRLYFDWMPVLRSLGLPVALVLQDGLERLKHRGPFPHALGEVAAVFVGGSTEWKLSDHAARFIREAKDAGKLVHVGRVNSLRRIEYFAPLGVDSIDGSGFSAWGDKRIHLAVKWIDRALTRRQLTMFGGTA